MFSKVSKKIVAATLACAMVASAATIAAPADTSAAAKVKLNKKKLSLSVGGKAAKLKASAKAKWSSSNKQVASVKGKGKKATVTAIGAGKCTITASASGKKATCKVTVKAAKSGTVIYNLAKETGSDSTTGESFAAPVKCPYSEFKYNSFRIWLCRATFYDPGNGGKDYRGKKINISVTLKNSGKNDLAELGFCFNYTKGTYKGKKDGSYPFAYHVINSKLRKKIAKKANKKWSLKSVKKDKHHLHATVKEGKIKKGKTYTYNFSFTIPKDAMNGDKDPDTNINYPIMFFIPNLKDNCPYQAGDQITVLKAKFTIA
ncbi:Ig-like domain-containing protein [Eubacterium xylanophilum]|uniref:Ig-like domain-containing protein n=1 Tax=Eubacterium xylanophilum TaxID=39497 RepID=UPI00047EAC38|nr:hypothetical protein [Eubacterium xylanophilum]